MKQRALLFLCWGILLSPVSSWGVDVPQQLEVSIREGDQLVHENHAVQLLQSQLRRFNPLSDIKLVDRREPEIQRGVEPISWLNAVEDEGDGSEKAVESASRGPSYLRYVVPVAVILAAGTTTYLLFSVRSR